MSMKRAKIWKSLAALALIYLTQCGTFPAEPERSSTSLYPKQPGSIQVTVSDRLIRLVWQKIDQPVIAKYYIYRADSLRAGFTRFDSTTQTEYKDVTVQNGRSYIYQISAKSADGYEGQLSETVTARCGFYALSINAGAAYTRTTTVQLSMVAPEATRYVLIGNDSTFLGAHWELYSATRTWELTASEGYKTVYARFRSSDDSEIFGRVSDDIILDTQAAISRVEFNSKEQPLRAGNYLRIRATIEESSGHATVDIGSRITGLSLFDDATHGDVKARDGIYSLDWLIPAGLEVLNELVTCNFVDAVGNSARSLSAEQRLIIKNPPLPVNLLAPNSVSNAHDRLYLAWSPYTDAGFVNYRMYRDMDPRVDSTSTLIGIISSATTVSLVDSNLTASTTYYYRIYVTDAIGYMAGSNTVSAKTPANLPPAAVRSDLSYLESQRMSVLNWTKNLDRDFGSYRVYRSESPTMGSQTTLLSVITDRNTTTYQDKSLSEKTTYYYAVYVYDINGLSSVSNIVNFNTGAFAAPKPVLLATPAAYINSALRLSWSTSTDEHFQSYRIYRSKTVNVDSTQAPIALLNSVSISSYDDMGLEANITYYYRIFVYDIFGHSAGSNKVSGKTLP
jgi:fibronectin type 3 domain-containing protein